MFFSWFNTHKVDAFIDAEVAELLRRIPPAKLGGEGGGARKAAEQLAKSHDLLLRHAQEFVQREKPNLYQKARIANRIRWTLAEARYPKEFVEGLAYALASVVAGANSQREI